MGGDCCSQGTMVCSAINGTICVLSLTGAPNGSNSQCRVHLWNVYDVEDTTEDCYIIKKRAEVEDGMLKAIGQAVWIKNVEFL